MCVFIVETVRKGSNNSKTISNSYRFNTKTITAVKMKCDHATLGE